MPQVFPELGQIGSQAEHGYRETLSQYDDGDYRRYRRSDFKHVLHTIELKDISQARRDAVQAFFDACKTAATDEEFEFVFYSQEETSAVDTNGGLELTGQHKAIFTAPSITWTRSGKCRYSASIAIKLLN